MKDCNDHIPVLVRDGTSQAARYPKELEPSSVQIDGRSESDLIDFAYDFAGLLNFYNLENQVDGDWQAFLQQLKDHPEAVLTGELSPQASLFLSFLRLFKKQQNQLNGLTKKHLDTFFRDVLRIQPKAPAADQVHVLFELAKNVEPVLLKAGTALKAGKDEAGRELVYGLNEDIIVNHATVETIKSVLVDADNNQLVHAGEAANTLDGLEVELPEEDAKWPPFGRASFAKADIGLALASPVLWLQEGTRTITVSLNLRADDDFDLPTSVRNQALQIYLSGEEEWLGPYHSTPSLRKVSGRFQLQFVLNLPASEKPVAYYNGAVLDGNFRSIFPIMKVVPDTSSSSYLNALLQGVSLETAKIDVEVTDIQSLSLQNDQGSLDPAKAFLPFGSEPVRGSSFDLGYEEAFTKKLNEFKIHVDWMDVPSSNLRSYYSGYSLSGNQFKASLSYRNKNDQISTKTINLFNSSNNQSRATYTVSENPLLVSIIPQVLISAQLNLSSATKGFNLIQKKYNFFPGNNLVKFKLPKVPVQTGIPKNGFVKFDLLDDFLHRDYRQKYVKATVEYVEGDLVLPKEPYQPKIKSITLDYRASSSTVDFSQTSETAYQEKDVEFFQLGAFGQREVHGYLLSKAGWLSANETTLLADYSQQGELLIGLKEIAKGQILNLLIQVAEGSADPQKEKEPVRWSVLAHDYWMELKSDELLADATNGLLKSGIVKINLPPETGTDHNWMPDGLVWLRASVKANPDAICQLIGIHAQAALADLLEVEQHPEHLLTHLPAETISKLLKPNGSIKKVKQPYASFGGRSEEEDKAYYTRVSERLRHKNRAITLWDYERLVLQEFPEISKVKCLNHTCETLSRAPGHVNLVVVPDLQNRNAVNVLQPRVSKAVLEDVRSFIEPLAPSLIQIHVNNPLYEEVQLEFEVKFRTNYEFGYYKKELNRELIEFLSPWTAGSQTEIHFGGRIEKSVLLKFVETRRYVDFVSHFKMFHLASGKQPLDVESAVATNPRAILVSHNKHVIHNYNS
jgi:hypothetical protein